MNIARSLAVLALLLAIDADVPAPAEAASRPSSSARLAGKKKPARRKRKKAATSERTPVEAAAPKGCLDPAKDARVRSRKRWPDLDEDEQPTVSALGDLDGDGQKDVIVSFPSACGLVGCNPFYVYLELAKPKRGRACARFLGAFDGLAPTPLASKSHGVADLRARAWGLFVESEIHLEFDGKRYLKRSSRERECLKPEGCADSDEWSPWGEWVRFRPAIAAARE